MEREHDSLQKHFFSSAEKQPSSPISPSRQTESESDMTAFIGDRVAVKIDVVVFFGNVRGCFIHTNIRRRKEKLWLIEYNNNDLEEINITKLTSR